ncbi:hypothetical protein F8568_020305 [Actinomadura sp. LD22]|uniref:Uncharacterized protein n=1 Tax=Actinomadura physcomitrii TaxID=2650748 RepID=A0A6I4MEL2_9ACTN|nr:hypothetical protein [Actinomadura physcomitrii]MWA02674.1 hypothetical protein [Actinomadura physcomitrii]
MAPTARGTRSRLALTARPGAVQNRGTRIAFRAYPSGRVTDRAGRAVITAGYAFGAVPVLLLAVFGPARRLGRG